MSEAGGPPQSFGVPNFPPPSVIRFHKAARRGAKEDLFILTPLSGGQQGLSDPIKRLLIPTHLRMVSLACSEMGTSGGNTSVSFQFIILR